MIFVFFVLPFSFYLYGLSGSIPSYRDSGDLIASIYALGIAHPPGYALYVLLGKIFTLVMPFGNVAYRVNVLSALCAAGTISLLYRLLLRNSRNSTTALMAGAVALLFATSPAMVALARVAEMYTMATLLSVAILLCLQNGSDRAYNSAAVLLGLGLSVHATLLFLLPVFLVAYRRTLRGRPMICFALGLMIFLYLPIRAAQHPAINWGDPSSWRNFWRVVTRADYGGLKLHPVESSFSWTASSILAQLRYFAMAMKSEWGWAALLIGGLGIFFGIRQPESRVWTIGLAAAWLLSGPAFFLLSNLPLTENTTPAILQPYLLLCGVLWAPLVMTGFGFILSLQGNQRSMRNGMGLAGLAMAVLVLCRPLPMASQRNDFFAYDYARNLLRSLPPNAVLYEPDDPTHFSIRVLQLVENRRPDVVLLNFFRTLWGYEQIKREWPDLLPPIPIGSAQELERLLWTYSAQRRPFYAELPQKLAPVPYRSQGLVYRAQLESTSESRQEGEDVLATDVHRGDFVTAHHPDFFTEHLIAYYAAAENNLGIEYVKGGDWEHAIHHYQTALAIEPDQAAARQNLEVALQKIPKHL